MLVLFVAGNPQVGADLFKKMCEHCHSTIAPGGKHGYGPNLYGYVLAKPCHDEISTSLRRIWGRKAGTLPGYTRYTKANRTDTITWNEQTMFDYLKAPKKARDTACMSTRESCDLTWKFASTSLERRCRSRAFQAKRTGVRS
jgi:cytochrome c2